MTNKGTIFVMPGFPLSLLAHVSSGQYGRGPKELKDCEIRRLILGILDGIVGLFGAGAAAFIAGVGAAFEAEEVSTVIGLGFAAIPAAILGSRRGTRSVKRDDSLSTTSSGLHLSARTLVGLWARILE